MGRTFGPILGLIGGGVLMLLSPTGSAQSITGALAKWETITLDFTGPAATETDGRGAVGASTATPNPFLDYRLQVEFVGPSGQSYNVPGFFDGDGAGGGAGGVWRSRFTPDEPGQWSYNASFREGVNVAIDLLPSAGVASSVIDGTNGTFNVAPTPATAEGHFKTGRLEYVGGHYLKRRDGGYWLKSGADSPENWLGYKGFDNTQTKGSGGSIGVLHEFNAHLEDWRPGDPDWDTPDFSFADENDGRRIIGAANYLADRGVNSIYFLPMNIGGDAKDTHPFVNVSTTAQLNGNASNDNLHYDISKLAQWERLFRHTQTRDMQLHFVLNEAEAPNKRELDDATLGVERKLFYREMVARFGHHNAAQWNLSEEYNLNLNLGAATVKEFADYLSDVDPYDRPMTVHNAGNPTNPVSGPWAPFVGEDDFDVTSLQWAGREEGWGDIVEAYRAESTTQGRPLVVMIDEPESPSRLDLGPAVHNNTGADATRRYMTWDIYLSGGGGVEWFIHNRDQALEDFGEVFTTNGILLDLDQLWGDTAIARRFLEDNLPFWEMQPADDLLRNEDTDYGGGEVFAKPGETYAIYLPDGSNDDGPDGAAPELDLSQAAGEYTLRWFNPRTGVFVGVETPLTAGDWVSLGPTPDGFQSTNDWVALVEFAATGVAGDYNNDGRVDLADYTTWRDAVGQPAGSLPNDASGEPIGDTQYDAWVDQFGAGASPAASLPEPGAMASVVLTLFAAAAVKRRRNGDSPMPRNT
ncbi:MAG: DUF5060 domain-containing protein [Planctomycetota bacterium]